MWFKSKDTIPHTHSKNFNCYTVHYKLQTGTKFNFQLSCHHHQAFINSAYKLLYPTVIEVYCLLPKPYFNFSS